MGRVPKCLNTSHLHKHAHVFPLSSLTPALLSLIALGLARRVSRAHVSKNLSGARLEHYGDSSDTRSKGFEFLKHEFLWEESEQFQEEKYHIPPVTYRVVQRFSRSKILDNCIPLLPPIPGVCSPLCGVEANTSGALLLSATLPVTFGHERPPLCTRN